MSSQRTTTSSSESPYSYENLDAFEEPLVDLSPIPSTPTTATSPFSIGPDYEKPLIPGPKTAEDVPWDIAEDLSLLDIDNMADIPQMFRPQFDMALTSRMPRTTSKLQPEAPLTRSRHPLGVVTIEDSMNMVDVGGDARIREEDDLCCDDAREQTVPCYFCWPCSTIFCDRCWYLQRAHTKRIQTQGGIPHEQTDPFVAKKIHSALESELTDEQQAMLHVQDEDTSWFGAGMNEQDDMVFQDYGRYANVMAENSSRRRKLRYPSLVSFVGQTGAGKSTLIRLLIELCSSANTRLQVPVVGSVSHQETPTSGDVHLYCDPKTSDGEHPVLYADCEGLDGGEREPMGAKSRNRKVTEASGFENQKGLTNLRPKQIRQKHNTSEREILWATTEETRRRDFLVRNLYPRLLFTFSDVVVFVMKNPRVIELVIEQLIRWAAVALETSSNQPVLPHAIIVLNASDNATDASLWDVDNSTAALMTSVRGAINQNHTLRNYADFWRKRNRAIESVESLLTSYYSSVRVVRVPERGRPKLINNQLQRLHQEIAIACERSRSSKHKVRMLLNSDELQPYLQYAFDHFCRDLDFPFDFVQASFANNPIPSDFGGNILKIAINIMDVWKNKLDGPRIFKELSFLVASCIMLDSARHRTLGPAEKVFPEYIEHCDDALDDFCDRHWPCEYMGDNGRCVNVKAGHNTKGHQLKGGQVLAVGGYCSSFTPEKYRLAFRDDIYIALAKLLENLQEATRESTHLELEQAANIHRDSVLKNFFKHITEPQNFISHTACFSCLVSPPEHPLPCGHVLCTPCVKAFGTLRGRTAIEMKYCPLHQNDTVATFDSGWTISLKPPSAGARILALDGGGIRAIVELTILQQIERALGVGLPIQAFFDLIVGTSTGGMIALGLGAQGWSVQSCIEHFEELCKKAFTKRKGIGFPGLDFIFSASNHSRYASKPLEMSLQAQFGEESLFGGLRDSPDSVADSRRTTKVAVPTTTTNGTVFLLANYNRVDTNDGFSYQFHRSEKPQGEIKTWEAARATSAAPRIFKPFTHEPTGQIFQDGAIYYNNPIELAMREKRLIWPETAEAHPDVVLSIGTGCNPRSSRQVSSPVGATGWRKTSHTKQLAKMAIDNIQSTLSSEQTWHKFVQGNPLPEGLEKRYIRLNLPLQKDPPNLADVSAMAEMKEATRSLCMEERLPIRSIANRLIATSFYFELNSDSVTEDEDRTIALKGNILCRFAPGSKEVRALGEAFRKRSTAAYNQGLAEHNPYFVIAERRKESEGMKSIIAPHVVEKMIQDAHFAVGQINFSLSDRIAETEISLCFADTYAKAIFYPISGFPRCLLEEERKVVAKTRLTRSLSRKRTPTTARRRGAWTLPVNVEGTVDPIGRYGDPDYLFPGDATSKTLSRISQTFSPVSGASTSSSTVQDIRLSSYQYLGNAAQPAELSADRSLLDRGRPPRGQPAERRWEIDGREISKAAEQHLDNPDPSNTFRSDLE